MNMSQNKRAGHSLQETPSQTHEDKVYELLKHYEGLMLGASAGADNVTPHYPDTNQWGPDFVVKKRSIESMSPSSPLIFQTCLSLHMTGDGLHQDNNLFHHSYAEVSSRRRLSIPYSGKRGYHHRNSIPVYTGFDIIESDTFINSKVY